MITTLNQRFLRYSLQIATPPGQQGRNSRSSKDIIPGQQKLVKKRDNIISPAVFHRQERREAQASACGRLPTVTKAASWRGLVMTLVMTNQKTNSPQLLNMHSISGSQTSADSIQFTIAAFFIAQVPAPFRGSVLACEHSHSPVR